MFVSLEIAEWLSYFTVVSVCILCFVGIPWYIRYCRRTNASVEEMIQNIIRRENIKAKSQDKFLKKIDNSHPAPKIPFYFSRAFPYGSYRKIFPFSRERSQKLAANGISPLNVATFKVAKMSDIIYFSLLLSKMTTLRYLVVLIAESRFVESMMSRAEVIAAIKNGLHVHFLCQEKLPVRVLENKYKILFFNPPFPGLALFLFKKSSKFSIRSVYYPSGRMALKSQSL